ncbi:transcription factor, contains a PHD finger motif [Neonectria punicea]|uniref:Transcription factor, contains a PHD finger motif n=1 Tax=Neonectria punicea TaxID=979145 RepID=A0ABR1GHU5_9HYPO
MASSEVGSPKREPTPTAAPLSSIPQKRALDEGGHSPAVPSPLNPEVKPSDSLAPDDAAQASRSKPTRAKKDTLKKRESKGGALGGDSARATPDPKAAKEPKQSKSSPLRYKLAPPKPSDFELPRGPVMTLHHELQVPNGETVKFFEASDHVCNKKNFRYTHCIADPLFPSMIYYRQTEPEPFGPRMSFEDAAGHVFFDKSARQVTTDKGFRMARANVAVREGRSYWECKITQGIRKAKDGEAKSDGGKHVRMGWARREASLDAPVGFDAYSYGIRDVSGEKVHMSRPKDFFPAGERIEEGDVIGLEIQLPSEQLHRKIMAGQYNPAVDQIDDDPPLTTDAPNIVRDRVPIRFKAHTYFEKIEYHTTKELEDLMNPASTGSSGSSEVPNPIHPTPSLRTLPDSCIRVYKNGVLMGTAFENLLGFLPPASRPTAQVGAREGLDDGMLGYYPAVSVFRGGAVEVNFGPDFWYPPPGYDTTGGEVDMVRVAGGRLAKVHAVSSRYCDQIAEDIVYDIIDEVDFWMQDGGGATDRQGVSDKSEAVALAPGREEIKELVQDDY